MRRGGEGEEEGRKKGGGGEEEGRRRRGGGREGRKFRMLLPHTPVPHTDTDCVEPGIVLNWLGLQTPMRHSWLCADEKNGWGFIDTFVKAIEEIGDGRGPILS